MQENWRVLHKGEAQDNTGDDNNIYDCDDEGFW